MAQEQRLFRSLITMKFHHFHSQNQVHRCTGQGAAASPPESSESRKVWQHFIELYQNSGNCCRNQWKDGKFELISWVMFAEIIRLPAKNCVARAPMMKYSKNLVILDILYILCILMHSKPIRQYSKCSITLKLLCGRFQSPLYYSMHRGTFTRLGTLCSTLSFWSLNLTIDSERNLSLISINVIFLPHRER